MDLVHAVPAADAHECGGSVTSGKCWFAEKHPLCLSLTVFLAHFHDDSTSWGKEWVTAVPLRAGHSIVSYSLHTGQLWTCVLIAVYCRERPL